MWPTGRGPDRSTGQSRPNRGAIGELTMSTFGSTAPARRGTTLPDSARQAWCAAGKADDEPAQQQVEHHRDRDGYQYDGGLERLPVEQVAADQLRRYAGRQD